MKYRMKIENSRYMMASQVKKKETVKIKQSMTRTTGSFRAMTLRGKGAEQEEDVSGKMRQRSVMFLLDMLFGEHARRLPSFGSSDLSSSWGIVRWGDDFTGVSFAL